MSTSLGRPREPRQAAITPPSINVTSLLAQVLGQYIPGYTYLTEVLRDKLGIDADRVLAVFGFFFGGWALFNYLQNIVIPRILSTFTSSLLLERNDQTYEDFTTWISKRRVFQYARSIRIVGRIGENRSAYQNPYSPFSRGESFLSKSLETDFTYAEEQDENQLFDFAALEAKRPLMFEPEAGTYWFIYKRRLFLFNKDHDPLMAVSSNSRSRGSSSNDSNQPNTIRLTCIGLSTTPLKELMETARAENYEDMAFRTSIFRPGGMNRFERYSIGPSPWVKAASRPSRPLESVVLSRDQKEKILKDWNSFLHPSRQTWFAARGIPYRRGYLFSGPPGTGKTSICYALAGVFGVDVFVVALGDVHLGDADLAALLTDLPARCVVVLEDIDCVGSSREEDDDDKDDMLNPWGRGGRNREMSLSGLLNAIDGVGSHEGHILVMTTNYPDQLDDALKRPGRIDMHVPFKLASHRQIMEIFIRIFSVTEDKNQAPGRKGLRQSTVEKACLESSELTDGRTCPYMSNAELLTSAKNFAESFEEELFSPAEIQGFLLMHKSDPVKALEEVSSWIPATLAAREKARLAAEKAKERKAAKKAALLAQRDEMLAGGMAPGTIPPMGRRQMKQLQQMQAGRMSAELLKRVAGDTGAAPAVDGKEDAEKKEMTEDEKQATSSGEQQIPASADAKTSEVAAEGEVDAAAAASAARKEKEGEDAKAGSDVSGTSSTSSSEAAT